MSEWVVSRHGAGAKRYSPSFRTAATSMRCSVPASCCAPTLIAEAADEATKIRGATIVAKCAPAFSGRAPSRTRRGQWGCRNNRSPARRDGRDQRHRGSVCLRALHVAALTIDARCCCSRDALRPLQGTTERLARSSSYARRLHIASARRGMSTRFPPRLSVLLPLHKHQHRVISN